MFCFVRKYNRGDGVMRDYPVYGTQGGGLAREVNGVFVFIEKPDCPGFDVGDELPEEWDVIPANVMARDDMDDNRDFNQGLNEFFDIAFDKVGTGDMSLDQVEQLFPKNVFESSK